MSTVVLVEFLEDIADAIAIKQTTNATLIALTAEAMDGLDAHGAPFDIWTSAQRQQPADAVGYQNLERWSRISAALDHTIGIEPGRSSTVFAGCHGWELLQLLSALGFRAPGLAELLATRRPSQVIGFVTDWSAIGSLAFTAWESAWTGVLHTARRTPAFLGETALLLRPTRATARSVRARIQLQQRGFGWLDPALLGRRTLKQWSRGVRNGLDGVGAVHSVSAPTLNCARILIVGETPELKLIERHLTAASDVEVWLWRDEAQSPQRISPRPTLTIAISAEQSAMHEPPDSADTSAWTPDLWTWSGLDCSALARARWQSFRRHTLAATMRSFCAARAILQTLQPDVVLHAEVGVNPPKRAVLEAAGDVGQFTACLQWGGNYGYMRQPYLDRIELRSARFLAYTPEVATRFPSAATPASRRATIQAEPAASPYFAGLRGRLAESGDRGLPEQVVYVLSEPTGNIRYGPHLCIEDTTYFALQKTVIRVSASAVSHRMVVKLHPAARLAYCPITDWLSRSRLNVAATRAPLESLLAKPSVWILDNLATAFQQVALTGDPVIYVDTGGPQPLDAVQPVIASRVTWIRADDPDFEQKLTDSLRCAQQAAPARADEFVNRFVLDRPLTQGEALSEVERVLKALCPRLGTLVGVTAEKTPHP